MPVQPSPWCRWRLALVVLLVATGIPLLAGTLRAGPAAAAGVPDLGVTVDAVGSVLVGGTGTVTVEVANSATSSGPAYNVSYRVVLPEGVSLDGPASPAGAGAPRIVASQPSTGFTTLVWENVADVQAGGVTGLSLPVRFDGAVLPVGSVVSMVGEAYGSSDPRIVPRFDAAGLPVPGTATASGSAADLTRVTAIAITKSEPSPEHELLRGVHNHVTTYTLEVVNNETAATTGVVVEDFIPAGLEFLGCGGVDNSSGPEYPGAPSLADSVLSPCVEPATVTTVDNPTTAAPDEVPLGGVHTVVRWNLGDLAPSARVTIRYLAGVPLFENVVPSTSGFVATANLDNNSGPSTGEGAGELGLTNRATVRGSYTGPVTGTGRLQGDADSVTVTAEDFALQKSVGSGSLVAGSTVTWLVDLEAGEYRSITGAPITVRDSLPFGLCPLDPGTNWSQLTPTPSPECDPASGPTLTSSAGTVALPFTSVTAGPGGYEIMWTLPSTLLAPDATAQISFPTRVRSSYDDTGERVVAGDGFTNTVAAGGVSASSGTDLRDPTPVADESSASLASGAPVIDKQVSLPAPPGQPLDCSSASFVGNGQPGYPPVFQRGDRACWRLLVQFPVGVDTRNAVVTDFLPANVSLASTWVSGPSNTVPATQIDVTIPATDQLEIRVGRQIGASRFTGSGRVLDMVLPVDVIGPPQPAPLVDLAGNLMKFRSESTAGDVTSLRDDAELEIAVPQLSLTKGVERVTRPASGVVDGPWGPDVDNRVVAQGDTVRYRVDVTNVSSVAAADIELVDRPSPVAVPSCGQVSAVVPATLTCTAGAGATLAWTLPGVLAPGGSTTVTYDVTLPSTLGPNTSMPNTARLVQWTGVTNQVTAPAVYVPGVDGVPAAGTSDPSEVHTGAAGLTKSATTSVVEAGNSDAQATVGEEITYTVSGTVPPGTTVDDGLLTDVVPAGLVLVGSPSATVNGVDATTLGFAVSTNPVRLTFPPVYSVPSTESGRTIVLRYTVRVADTRPTNQRNGLKVNTAQLTRSNGPPLSASATVTIVEPVLTVPKSHTGAGPFAPGATVPFTITVRNGSGANTSIAHDVVVQDVLPAGTTYVAGSASGGGTYDGATRTLAWTVGALAPSSSTTRTYDVTIDSPAVASTVLTNRATATANSLADGSGRAYVASSADTVTVVGPTIGKVATPTSATVGATVSFVVSVVVPADVALPDLTVFDTLPNGLAAASYGPASCTTACSPTITATPLTPSGNRLGWTLGDVAPSSSPRTVSMTVVASVTDVAGNRGGTSLTNAASLAWNATDRLPSGPGLPSGPFDVTGPSTTATVQVVEPLLAIAKAVSASTIQPTGAVTYTVTVTNTSASTRSPAYDVLVRDRVPAGLLVGDVSGGGVLAGSTLTWTLPGPLAPGASVSLTYQASLAASGSVGPNVLRNTASVASYSSLPGAGRTYVGPSASADVTPHFPAPSITKVAVPTPPDALLGQPFPWRIVVRNTDTVADAVAPVVTDVLPAGWTFAGATITGPLTLASSSVTGSTVTFSLAGTLGPLQAATLDVVAVPTLAATASPGAGFGPLAPHTNTATVVVGDRSGATANASGPYTAGPATADAFLQAADLAVVKSGPVTATAGATFSYTLTVTNHGPSPSSGVITVADVPPAPLHVVSASGPGWSCTTAVGCTTATVAASGQSLPAITVVVTSPSSASSGAVVRNVATADMPGLLDPDLGNNTDAATTTLRTSADLALTKVATGSVTSGTTLVYVLTVRNLGPSDAAAPVTVVDTLPGSVTAVAVVADGWTSDTLPASGTLTLTRTTPLVAGTAAPTIAVVARVDAGVVVPSLTNTATVTSPTHDPDLTNNTDDASVTGETHADLAIDKTLTSSAVAGATATYRLDVANLGPSDAAAPVIVDDVLPASTTFVSATGSGWQCVPTGAVTVRCTRDAALGAGDHADPITLTVLVGADTGGATLTNVATVTSPTDDPDLANNTDREAAAVARVVDLAVVKSHGGAVVIGGSVTFSLVVANRGPSDDVGAVTVTDTLPGGLTPTAASGPGWLCTVTGQAVRCATIGLTAGSTAATVSVTASVGSGAYPSVANTATVTGTERDPEPGNNTSTDTVGVPALVDLAITKTHAGTFVAGGQASWSLRVTNNGPTPEPGAVTIVDVLPAGTTFVSATGASCSAAGQTVTCTIAGGLGVGAVVDIALVVDVGLAAVPSVTNVATVSGPSADANVGNNRADDTATVLAGAALRLDTQLVGSITSGGRATWRITVTNDGPAASPPPMTVVFELPAGLVFVSGGGEATTCAADGQRVTCTRTAALAVGASFSVDIVTLVTAPPGTTLRNSASVTSVLPNPRPVVSRLLTTQVLPPVLPPTGTGVPFLVTLAGVLVLAGLVLRRPRRAT